MGYDWNTNRSVCRAVWCCRSASVCPAISFHVVCCLSAPQCSLTLPTHAVLPMLPQRLTDCHRLACFLSLSAAALRSATSPTAAPAPSSRSVRLRVVALFDPCFVHAALRVVACANLEFALSAVASAVAVPQGLCCLVLLLDLLMHSCSASSLACRSRAFCPFGLPG